MKLARVLAMTSVALGVALGHAEAGPDQVSVLLGSHHIGATRSFEEFNPGLFLTWTEAAVSHRVDLSVGAFRNSYGDASLALSGAYPLYRTETWGFDLFAGLAWYPGNGDQFSHAIDDMVPLAGAQMRYRNLFMQALPAGGNSVDATLTFGLTFQLD
ncbi:hypothetical protein [Ruegeria marina]|uniref:Uncharacterized protein n=1 Tax=Ruegeria marina TaxID=639004 RepID=A0A1G6XIS2_9RHOB|nr:hypothetical protein [Ruegeria marina]SDD78099.1 hypothetical protein SAMN04488239_11094 [Ruegeria marina]